MAILFRCQCAKKMQASPAFAGRQMRCPGCTRILTIPGGAPEGDFVRFACSCGKKMKACKSDAGAEVDCPRCGQEVRIPKKTVPPAALQPTRRATRPRAAVVPTPIASPRPAAPTRAVAPVLAPPTPPPAPARPVAPVLAPPTPPPAPLPPRVVAVLPSPPSPTPAPRSSRSTPRAGHQQPGQAKSEDTVFHQHITSWREEAARKRNGRLPPEPRVKGLPWLTILALLAIALLATEWFLTRGTGAGATPKVADIDELTLIPPDAAEAVTVRFDATGDEPRRGQDSQTIRHGKKLLSSYLTWSKSDLERFTEDVERVTEVWMPPYIDPMANMPKVSPEGPKKPPIVHFLIVHTRKPVVPTVIKHHFGAKFESESFFRRIYYKAKPKAPPAPQIDKALHFVSDNVFVVGNVQSIEHFLRSRPSPNQKYPLVEILQAAASHDMAVGYSNPTHHGVVSFNPPLAVMTFDEPKPNELSAKLELEFVKAEDIRDWKNQNKMKTKKKAPAPAPAKEIGNKVVYIYEGKGPKMLTLDTVKANYAFLYWNRATLESKWEAVNAK